MRPLTLAWIAAGALTAQSVTGPIIGYLVDSAAQRRPIYGTQAAAHIGASVKSDVRESRGSLTLGNDGSAFRSGTALEGRWASLDSGAFLDDSRRELLVAGETATPWRLSLPDKALAVRASYSGDKVTTLLADESLAVWSAPGKAEFRVAASKWWSFAFVGERVLAYDPAANSLLWVDGPSGASLLRKLDGQGGLYSLAVDRTSSFAVLQGERLVIVPLTGGDIRVLNSPEGSDALEPVQGGRTFLLARDPSKPIWLLDPGSETPLQVIPPAANEKAGQQ